MPFRIGEEDFFEDINLSQEQFYQKLGEDLQVSTSQPSPDSLMTLWDKVLQDYDQIIYTYEQRSFRKLPECYDDRQ